MTKEERDNASCLALLLAVVAGWCFGSHFDSWRVGLGVALGLVVLIPPFPRGGAA